MGEVALEPGVGADVEAGRGTTVCVLYTVTSPDPGDAAVTCGMSVGLDGQSYTYEVV
jgi:hypothetical protein